MNKLILTVAFVVGSFVTANAENAPTGAAPAWSDVLKTCSAEYKERADKTKGREVWTACLTDCKARKGFVAKKDQGKGEFNRVPDKGA